MCARSEANLAAASADVHGESVTYVSPNGELTILRNPT